MTTLYIALSDALLVVRRQGGQWQTERQLVGMTAQCITVDPLQPQRTYCGTFGNGLWRSDDAGATWRPVGTGIPYKKITSVAVSQLERAGAHGIVYAGAEPSTLFRSEDGGQTWHERPTLRQLPSAPTWSFPPRPHTSNVHAIALDPHVEERIFVAIEQGGVMRSFDAGLTWEDRKPDGPRDSHILVTHRLAPNRIYSANGDGFGNPENAFKESRDGGSTWQHDSQGIEKSYCWGLAIDPANPDTIIISGAPSPQHAHEPMSAEGTIYRKVAGEDWKEERPVRARTGSLAYHLASNEFEPGIFYAVSNQGVYRSPDAGLTWERLNLMWRDDYRTQHLQGFQVVEN